MEFRVEVDGVEISCLTCKQRDVVYVHGSGCDAEVWKKQLCDVGGVAIDLPNHGKSGSAEISSADDYARYVAGVGRELFGKATFVGHSLGGAVVQKVYLNHPEVVKSLVLVSTGARLRVLPEVFDFLLTHPEKGAEAVVGMAFASNVEEREEYRKLFCERAKTLVDDLRICDRFDLLDDYRNGEIEIDVPVLIIVGSDDRLTPVKYSEFFRSVIPNSELVVVEGAGHMVMLEKAEEFNAALKDFLS